MAVELVGGHQELLGSGEGPIPAGLRGSTPGAGARAPWNCSVDPALLKFIHRRNLGILKYRIKVSRICGTS